MSVVIRLRGLRKVTRGLGELHSCLWHHRPTFVGYLTVNRRVLTLRKERRNSEQKCKPQLHHHYDASTQVVGTLFPGNRLPGKLGW